MNIQRLKKFLSVSFGYSLLFTAGMGAMAYFGGKHSYSIDRSLAEVWDILPHLVILCTPLGVTKAYFSVYRTKKTSL